MKRGRNRGSPGNPGSLDLLRRRRRRLLLPLLWHLASKPRRLRLRPGVTAGGEPEDIRCTLGGFASVAEAAAS